MGIESMGNKLGDENKREMVCCVLRVVSNNQNQHATPFIKKIVQVNVLTSNIV